MRYVLTCFLYLLLISCVLKPGLMTEKAFADKYMEALRQEYPDLTFTLKPDLSITAMKGGKEAVIYIENAYGAYKIAPDDIDETIRGYVTAVATAFAEEHPAEIANIIPLIKPITFMHATGSGGSEFASPMVTEQYNDQLAICYAEDTKEGFRFLLEDTLDSLKIPRDSLYPLAVRNLLRIIPDVETYKMDGIYMLSAGGFYDASLILLPSLWQRLDSIEGEWIIAVPKRDFLMLTGSRNKEGLNKMRKIAKEDFKAGQYPVSDQLFRWNGKKFEVLPSGDSFFQ